jgi:hypothetical protein
MMNGAKKSDPLIVPAKPANKAGHAAELVEGSSGTERNAELQRTVRTQSREAVSQAQDRIRGAVTRDKKESGCSLITGGAGKEPYPAILDQARRKTEVPAPHAADGSGVN